MNLSNVILIIAAILLLWGAINLDRTSQRRVIEDQSSQLNDSMEILNRLKGKSPEEKSKSRRVDEYSKIVNKAVEENPEHIEQIEANFVAGTSSSNANLESLLNSTNQISANLEEIGVKSTDSKAKQEIESRFVIDNLTKLVHSINAVEASSQEFSRNSAVLSKNIAEVNEYLA